MVSILSTFLSALGAVTLATSQSASAQCVKYSVEIFAGPACQILPSWAGAFGISNAGAICGGYVDCGENGHHVIWWPNGDVTEMPPSSDGGIPDSPFGINSSGQVAGRMYVPDLDPNPDRAFLYTARITQNLGTLPGGNFSEASALNDSGVVCGYSTGIGQPLQAFVWQDGKMSALMLPIGKSSVANDISDTNLICGWMGDATWLSHAFIWSNGQTIDLKTVLRDANGASATGLNSAGSACGYAMYGDPSEPILRHGFLWINGLAQDLGVLPNFINTTPYGVDNSHRVVGYCDNFPVSGLHRAFVWQNGVMQALNDLVPLELNLNIREAWDINNVGQIVAQATRPGPNGPNTVAVRLTPIPPLTGDLDCDWQVNVPDLLSVIGAWGPCPPHPPGEPFTETCHADFNDDGVVNHHDIVAVVLNWTS